MFAINRICPKTTLKLLLALLLLAATYPGTTFSSEGRRWTYYTAAPAGPTKDLPLVILLHGAGGSGGGFLDRSGWGEKAKSSGFVAIAPSAQAKNPDEPPDFLRNPRIWDKNEDFAIDLLANSLQATQCDPSRVYLVGHSSGAMFAYRLAIAYPKRWRAIACLAAPTPPLMAPLSKSVPTLAIYGCEDQLMPLQGGQARTPWGTRTIKPVEEMNRAWAKAMGLSGTPQEVSENDAKRTVRYGRDFQALYLKGHGHNYPSPETPLVEPSFGPVRCDVPVNDLIWDFFQAHGAAASPQ